MSINLGNIKDKDNTLHTKKTLIPQVFFLPLDVLSNMHPLIKIIRPLFLLGRQRKRKKQRQGETKREKEREKEKEKSKEKNILCVCICMYVCKKRKNTYVCMCLQICENRRQEDGFFNTTRDLIFRLTFIEK